MKQILSPIRLSRLLVLAALAAVCGAHAEDALFIQPYLQNVSQSGITIQWWTHESAPSSQVEYGADFQHTVVAGDEWIAAIGDDGAFLHRAVLTGLQPQTTYSYRVRSGALVSPAYTFRTAVLRSSDFHVAVLGDSRTDDAAVIGRARETLRLAMEQEPDLALADGDFVYSGDQIHWDRFWRRIATASDPLDPGLTFASRIPCYLAVGNHEIYQVDGVYAAGNLSTTMARFRAYVDAPANGSRNPDWEERYYAFRYGVATFIVLDANNTSDDALDNHSYLPDGSTPDWEPGSEQYEWMIQRLAAARDSSAFTFVLMHPSPYCRGVHGAPDESQSGWQLRVLDPVFRQYGVDAVLSSHDHMVERCLTGPRGYEETMDDTSSTNLNYIVMGNSGHSARAAASGWESWMDITGNDGPPYYTRYFYDWSGTTHSSFIDLSVEDQGNGRWQVHLRIMRDDGEIFDPLTLERRDPLYSLPTNIQDIQGEATPQGLRLRQNHPNPFNSTTTVEFAVGGMAPRETTEVSLEVYDLLGHRVCTLFDGPPPVGGSQRVYWNGRNTAGRAVGSGCYFCVMTAGNTRMSRMMTLLK